MQLISLVQNSIAFEAYPAHEIAKEIDASNLLSIISQDRDRK